MAHIIQIDENRTAMMDEHGKALMKEFYCMPDESIQQAFARASVCYCDHDYQFAQRIYDYVSNGWMMFSSPILSNARLSEHEYGRGLPISCYLTYVPNSLEGLINHTSELRWLSISGGGVGGHWSDVQGVSQKSQGTIPFMKTVDSDMCAYRQGKTRKGSYAAYLDVSHPDIVEFIHMRNPIGGDANRKCLNLHHGVNLTDRFMQAVEQNTPWELVCPRTKMVIETVKARDIWQSILETRYRTGEPYLHFIDTSNRALHPSLKSAGLKINGSNLCSEIMLATERDRTAVCCLSSLNLEHFDEWKNTQIVEDLVRFLDNVLTYFTIHCPSTMDNARRSALRERSIGVGAMGWHYYLQKHLIAFDSIEAIEHTEKVFTVIQNRALAETRLLARERGEPLDMQGTKRRNAHLTAIAPNANSSTICNTSPSIEPVHANVFTHRSRSGSFLVKNKILSEYLANIGADTEEVWNSIALHDGSVQHLHTLLPESVRMVFKTAHEIDPKSIIRQAAIRQGYIEQGQSINLYFEAKCDRNLLHVIHFDAWKRGLKSLYYLRTRSDARAESVEKTHIVSNYCTRDNKECVACQG